MSNLILQVNIPRPIKDDIAHTFTYDEELYKQSAISIERYAKRIGVEYKCITESRFPHPAFDRFQLFQDDYREYDQILYVDCDIFLHDLTPNLLDWTQHRKETFFATPDSLKTPDYFNTGFFVIKRPLIERLKGVIDEYVKKHTNSRFKDQDAMNDFMIKEEWCKLSRDWNGVMALNRPLFSIHYAGIKKTHYTIDNHRVRIRDKMCRIDMMTKEEVLSKYLPQQLEVIQLF